MPQAVTFNDALEAVDQLSSEDQEELVAIVRRRLADRRRRRLLKDVRESQQEFAESKCKVVNADELMKEIMS